MNTCITKLPEGWAHGVIGILRAHTPIRFLALKCSIVNFAALLAWSSHAQFLTNSPNWDLGDGRHGSFIIPTNMTIEQVYDAVRLTTDPPIYDPFNPRAVPNLVNVLLTNNASLSVVPWDGRNGGILILKAQGSVYVSTGSQVTVSASGYRGGMGAIYTTRRGDQGESYNGTGSESMVNNCGGGGGGSDPSATGTAGGGAGGGYGSSGQNGQQGEHGASTGGATYGEEDIGVLFLGSGGGGGGVSDNSRDGGQGGRGGGALAISAFRLSVLGEVSANGEKGHEAVNVKDGSGGGGSGGSVLLRCVVADVGTSRVAGSGGLGGTYGGDGGAGGVGRVKIEYSRALSGATTPASSVVRYQGILDTDGDGIPDDIEVGPDAFLPSDLDHDGEPDYRQYDLDNDRDWIPDGWELQHGLNPFSYDAGLDVDADGLTNYEEYNFSRTNALGIILSPTNAFSASDPLGDLHAYTGTKKTTCTYDRNDHLVGVEYPNGSTLVYVYDGNDNIIRQLAINRLPNADGLPSVWKALSGLSPTNSTGGNSLYADADGDGWSNYQEWKAGTLPLDPNSKPAATNLAGVPQTAPISVLMPEPSQGSGLALVNVTLYDGEGNPSTPFLQYSNAASAGWSNATLVSIDGLAHGPVSAPPTGSLHQITWNAGRDLGAGITNDLLLRACASDVTLTGAWSQVMAYHVSIPSGTLQAVNDVASTTEDTPKDIDVLANDLPIGGTKLIVSLGQPAHGTAATNVNRTVRYTPAENFSGADSFTYTLSDDAGGLSIATVTVTVTPANDPPFVYLTSPTNGARFITGNGIAIEAVAGDVDGHVVKVEFLVGTNRLVELTHAPYVYTWFDAPIGAWTLFAKATDDSGASALSPGVTVTNTTPQLRIVPSITMSLQGEAGQVYRIQTSFDLEIWTDMMMVTNRTGTIEFTDPIGTNISKFFRALLAR